MEDGVNSVNQKKNPDYESAPSCEFSEFRGFGESSDENQRKKINRTRKEEKREVNRAIQDAVP